MSLPPVGPPQPGFPESQPNPARPHPPQHQPSQQQASQQRPKWPGKHRRRWPWVTGAVVVLVFALASVFGQQSAPTQAPTAGLVKATSQVSSHPATAGAPATTAPATTTTPPVTTTPPPVITTVAPPPVTKALLAPPTTHHTATTAYHPVTAPVTHQPTVPPAPPATQPTQPAGGKYHAGEFCSTVGATAISTTGAPMHCLQEGQYKRWHND